MCGECAPLRKSFALKKKKGAVRVCMECYSELGFQDDGYNWDGFDNTKNDATNAGTAAARRKSTASSSSSLSAVGTNTYVTLQFAICQEPHSYVCV